MFTARRRLIHRALAANDNLPVGGSATSFSRRIRVESENNRHLIKATGLKLIE